MRFLSAVLTFLVLALLPASTLAAGKVALVVGNAQYRNVAPLDNPGRDAELAARTFTALGFETTVLYDADTDALRNALRAFQAASAETEVAAIYFAGHGVQAGNVNYLLATDTGAESRAVFENSAVRMEEFLAAFAPSARVKLLIVDACRDNPFAATRSLEKLFEPDARGLSRVNHQLQDLVVIYSAQPDRKAYDGDGDNSPFMEAFSAVLTAREQVQLSEALIDITNFVRTKTADKQLPYTEGTLSVHVQLIRETPLQAAAAPEPSACPTGGEVIRLQGGAEDYLEYEKGPASLVIDDAGKQVLEVCLKGDVLLVHGSYDQTFTAEDLREKENEGSGYYFKTGDGQDAHLWFYADPDDPKAPAQIGVYINEDEITWITTGWVF
ncbi:caspase family protein [Roseibium sp. M-1]